MVNFNGAFILFGIPICFAITNTNVPNCFAEDDCNFYTCLESKFNCGPDGYPLSYGMKYCEIFKENQPNSNAAGQQWMTATRLCLQDSLVPIVYNAENKTCDALKQFAVDSHSRCYTQPGNSICDIGLVQIFKVFRLVGVQLTQDYFKQLLSVVKTCCWTWFTQIEQSVVDLNIGEMIIGLSVQSNHVEDYVGKL